MKIALFILCFAFANYGEAVKHNKMLFPTWFLLRLVDDLGQSQGIRICKHPQTSVLP